jgi:hypothetical protein
LSSSGSSATGAVRPAADSPLVPPSRRVRWCAGACSLGIALLASAAACSSNHASDGATGASCSFTSPIPRRPAVPDSGLYDYGTIPQGTTVQAYATVQGLVALDTLIGNYLRGDVMVYTGTLSAHDDQSVLGPDCPGDGGNVACVNNSIATGPAVASLVTTNGVTSLDVHSLAQHKYVVFQQGAPDGGVGAGAGVTTVGLVLSDQYSGGNSGTCVGCAPPFASGPESITIQNLVSSVLVPNLDAAVRDGGTTDANLEATLHTYAAASLTRATPCELTWADLVELNTFTTSDAPSLGSFVEQGGEWVTELLGNLYMEDTDGGEYESYCSVAYELELYVNASNLADYGVRNFQTYIPDAGYDYNNYCSQ